MILICSIMMLVAFHLNNWRIEPLQVNPLFGPKPDVLLQLGALQTREMIQTGTWYRLIAAIFLHGGLLHLGINLVVLGLLGRAVERNHGIAETVSIFFISAIGGNIISCLMQPGYILLGSSGGIFGLIGICVADIVLNWKILFLVFRNYDGSSAGWVVRFFAMFWLGVDLFLNSAVGFTPYVDNFAHLGGFTHGFFISLTVLQRLPLSFFGKGQDLCFKIRIGLLRVIGAALAVTLLFTTGTLLSQSDGIKSPCHKCRYISCIPFPFWSKDKWWYCDGCDAVSGKVFHRNTDNVFTDLDLFCPDGGGTVDINISSGKFKETSDLQKLLAKYCREYC
jgi:membrane associated rhomboid family serine protease